MATEDEIKARIEREAEEALVRADGKTPAIAGARVVVEPLIRALVKEEDARRLSDADFTEASKERDQAIAALDRAEVERQKGETALWAEIERLKKAVKLNKAAAEASMRLYLATVEGQS